MRWGGGGGSYMPSLPAWQHTCCMAASRQHTCCAGPAPRSKRLTDRHELRQALGVTRRPAVKVCALPLARLVAAGRAGSGGRATVQVRARWGVRAEGELLLYGLRVCAFLAAKQQNSNRNHAS